MRPTLYQLSQPDTYSGERLLMLTVFKNRNRLEKMNLRRCGGEVFGGRIIYIRSRSWERRGLVWQPRVLCVTPGQGESHPSTDESKCTAHAANEAPIIILSTINGHAHLEIRVIIESQ